MKLLKSLTPRQLVMITILVIGALLFIRLGSGHEISQINPTGFKLIGKWSFTTPDRDSRTSFTFFSDQTVRYIYSQGRGDDLEYKYEDGKWGIDEDILTMIYPKSDSLVFVQKVDFIDKNTVRFTMAPDSDFDPYIGIYYRVKK